MHEYGILKPSANIRKIVKLAFLVQWCKFCCLKWPPKCFCIYILHLGHLAGALIQSALQFGYIYVIRYFKPIVLLFSWFPLLDKPSLLFIYESATLC